MKSKLSLETMGLFPRLAIMSLLIVGLCIGLGGNSHSTYMQVTKWNTPFNTE